MLAMQIKWKRAAQDLEDLIDDYLNIPIEPTDQFHKSLANVMDLFAYSGGNENFLRHWAKAQMESYESSYGKPNGEAQHMEAKIELPYARERERLITEFADALEILRKHEIEELEKEFPTPTA